MLDEQEEHLLQDVEALARSDEHAGVARVACVAGGSAQEQAEVDARLHVFTGRDSNRTEPEIAHLGERAHRAAAIERERELARQCLQRAIAQDALLRLPRQRQRVDQLATIEARRGGGAHVANGVAAAAAIDDAELDQARQHVEGRFCLYPAQLQVTARGELQLGAAKALREVRHATQLMGVDPPPRETQATHERLFRGGSVEEPVKFVEVDLVSLREAALLRQRDHAGPELARRLAPFGIFLRREPLPGP